MEQYLAAYVPGRRNANVLPHCSPSSFTPFFYPPRIGVSRDVTNDVSYSDPPYYTPIVNPPKFENYDEYIQYYKERPHLIPPWKAPVVAYTGPIYPCSGNPIIDFGDTGSDAEHWDVEHEPDMSASRGTMQLYFKLHEEASRNKSLSSNPPPPPPPPKRRMEERGRREDKIRRRLQQDGQDYKAGELGYPYSQCHSFVYVDGCYRKSEKGGYGAILFGSHGKPIVAAAGVSERPISVLYHHLEGVKRGLELARKYGCERVEVRCNSRYAVGVVKGSFLPADCDLYSPVFFLIKEIQLLKSEFAFPVTISHVERESNEVADHLAKLQKEIEIEPPQFSSELQDLLCEHVKL